MAYPGNFLRLQVAGALYGGVERFSFGVNFTEIGGPADAPSVVPPALLTALEAMWGAQRVCPTWAAIDLVKLNLIGPDGKYVNQGDTVQHEYVTPVPGGVSGNFPPQAAIAVTLRTAANRGRASRGRFYLPASSGDMGTDGRYLTLKSAAIQAAAATFLNAAEDALPNWRVAVLSNIGAGTVRPVTGVQVGRVIDTIRSRRRSMPEEPANPTQVGSF